MGLGGSIFFLVLGAILVFAVRAEVGWIDLDAAGWIFMITGVVGIVLTSVFSRRRKAVHKDVHSSYQAERIARRQAIKRADAARMEETRAAHAEVDEATYPDSYVTSSATHRQPAAEPPRGPHQRPARERRDSLAPASEGADSVDSSNVPDSPDSPDSSDI